MNSPRWQLLEDDEGFETLSANMASGLIQVVHGQLAKEIQLIDDQLSKHGKYLNGRQMYWIVCNHFKVFVKPKVQLLSPKICWH